MRTLVLIQGLILILGMVGMAYEKPNEKVIVKTTLGEFTIELKKKAAPLSVKNFLKYVDVNHYDGTIFHRVIPGFMAQGGGLTVDLEQKETRPPVTNEAENGLKNTRGTVGMARHSEIDSATDQFYVNVVDNDFLDHVDTSSRNYGYAVFGEVIKGMDVVDKIVAVKTQRQGQNEAVPLEPIIIESVTRD